MIIDYKIDENDHLIFQLYNASKSKKEKKKRFINKILFPIIYILIGIFDYINDKYVSSIIFLSLAILWFILFPIWEKRSNIKHFKNFIKENYSEAIGRQSTIEISNDFIKSKSINSESTISTIEISEINEIPSHVFIKLKSGHTYVLPKDKIFNFDLVKNRLQELSLYLKINYNIDENWNWE
jgi:hypothetical protein